MREENVREADLLLRKILRRHLRVQVKATTVLHERIFYPNIIFPLISKVEISHVCGVSSG